MRGSVEAKYDGVVIEGSVDRVKVRLCNGGNREILEHDFVESLKIDVGESGRLLEYTLEEITDGVKVQAKPDQRGIELSCGSLNPKDNFLVTMLLCDWDGEVEVRGRVLGARIATYPSVAFWKGWFGSVLAAVSIVCVLFLFTTGSGIALLVNLFACVLLFWIHFIPNEDFADILRSFYGLPKI